MKETLINVEENKENKENKKNEKNYDEKELLKEIKKMRLIKYLNLFFSIFRFSLLLPKFSLHDAIRMTYVPSYLNFIMNTYNFFILSIFTTINLITITTGIINRNFIVNNNDYTLIYCIISCSCCFCWVCTKNVIILKQVNFICFLISLFWSFCLLYYVKNDLIIGKKDIIKLIIHFIDTILLFGQSYFFYYYNYFLNREKLYIELYKRLIIKNRKNEAECVRRELPVNIDEDNNSGTEMENV